jgi:hypothetical protein
MHSSDLMCASMLKNTPSRLARQTHSGGMIRKHCGWEAVIWHPPANVRSQLRLTQPNAPRRQPTNAGALPSMTRQPVPQQRHLTGPQLPLLPNRSKPISHREFSKDVSRHMHQKQKLRSGTYLHMFVQLVHVCWSFQITYMYLGFSSPISAISSSVLPAIFQSSLPALLPRFLLTKYNDMDA